MNTDKNLNFIKSYQYEIFVGIKDKDSYEEMLSVDDFKEIVTKLCSKKRMSFTLINQRGGYGHDKGYTTETSLRVIIVGVEENEMMKLAEELKKKVNTDTVLITKTEIEYLFL